MAAVPGPPELWSEFDTELDALMEGTKTAEKSYTEGKGMSLASIAVGSALMRLSKVTGRLTMRDETRATNVLCVYSHGEKALRFGRKEPAYALLSFRGIQWCDPWEKKCPSSSPRGPCMGYLWAEEVQALPS